MLVPNWKLVRSCGCPCSPAGLLQLPTLQSLGQAVMLSSELDRACALLGLSDKTSSYERDPLGLRAKALAV